LGLSAYGRHHAVVSDDAAVPTIQTARLKIGV
jgi:hypothetical protein